MIERIKIWFSKGSANQISIIIRLNGNTILPDPTVVETSPQNPGGDGVIGDDREFLFKIYREIKQSEILEVFYRNSDKVDVHDVMVTLELGDQVGSPRSQQRS